MNIIQKTFNTVIDNGFYPKEQHMCFALKDAKEAGYITPWQCWLSSIAIRLYIRKSGYIGIGLALFNSNHPYSVSDRIAIYKDWANRPKLLAKKHQKSNR